LRRPREPRTWPRALPAVYDSRNATCITRVL
jgi:hypothetical protein